MSSFGGRSRSWPAAVVGGVAGTTLMTLTLDLHSRLWPGCGGLIDYDASDHVTTAASRVLGWQPHTRHQKAALFDLVHWGYGSAVAIQYDELRRLLGERRGAIAFYLVCQATAMTLFPVLGDTPPPWRWRRNVLMSSLAEHALYAATVAVVSRAVRER